VDGSCTEILSNES